MLLVINCSMNRWKLLRLSQESVFLTIDPAPLFLIINPTPLSPHSIFLLLTSTFDIEIKVRNLELNSRATVGLFLSKVKTTFDFVNFLIHHAKVTRGAWGSVVGLPQAKVEKVEFRSCNLKFKEFYILY